LFHLSPHTLPNPDKPEPKTLNREGAKNVKNNWDFVLIQDPQDFLRDLRAFAVNILAILSRIDSLVTKL
jgi:hypothetical protein